MTYDELFVELCTGHNHLLILGAAGSGKSHLIHRLQEQSKDVLYTAPSGIAARNIKGVTLHSLFGLLPVTPQPQFDDVSLNENRISLLRKMNTLLIDEISMVSSDLLDKIDIVLREKRGQNEIFGGVRIIMVGDIFQLQPYIPVEYIPLIRKLYPEVNNYTFFNSKTFNDNSFLERLDVYQLEHDYRHENDEVFSELLSSIRVGRCDNKGMSLLNSRINNDNADYIHLATTRMMADYHNDNKMNELHDSADISFIDIKIISYEEPIINKMYPMKDKLSIKVGMKIIFIMNDNGINGKRWVNGTIGEIICKNKDNDGRLKTVTVLINDEEYKVEKEWYDIYIPYYNESSERIDSMRIASVCQFPFIEAWAITIHRSQSLTLNKIYLDLGAKVFAYGQLYVGLSRVRNLRDLFLNRNISRQDIKVCPETIRFYEIFIKPRMVLVYKEATSTTRNIASETNQIYEYDYEELMSDSVANNFKLWWPTLDNGFENCNLVSHDDNLGIKTEFIVENVNPVKNYKIRRIITEQVPKKIAPEGIDKIKIILNPIFINLENEKRHISPHNELTLHLKGPFRMLSIHHEYLRKNSDIYLCIANAIYELIQMDILDLQFLKWENESDVFSLILNNFDLFVIGISEVEFFFDMKKEDIRIKEKSIVDGYLIKITDYKTGAITYYTNDYNPKYLRGSYGIIYDREAKLIKNNQTSYKSLMDNPYKTRLEFRLKNISSDWLHINNLKGTCDDIIKRYLDYLAIIFKLYFLDHIIIDADENKYLNRIIKKAKDSNKKRYTNPDNKLKQQVPLKKEQMKLHNIEGREQKINELMKVFLEKYKNTKSG